ncbi:MAG TPA: energy transducer TonB [Sphingomicrobium sp.]
MFWIALAAQLTAAEPKEIWFNGTDFWKQELAQQSLAAVRLRITVTPEGTVQACEVEQKSGNPGFDARVCEVTMKRARFRPASLQDGTPAYGVFRVPVAFTAVRPGWYPRLPQALKPVADLNLPIDRLPKGKSFPLRVDVVFTVEIDGRQSSCAADGKKQDPNLVRLACREMSAQFKATPAKGSDGNTVVSVQNGRVFFIRP